MPFWCLDRLLAPGIRTTRIVVVCTFSCISGCRPPLDLTATARWKLDSDTEMRVGLGTRSYITIQGMHLC